MLQLVCAVQVFAALSIPSHYETFVRNVRARVVVHESDVRPRNSSLCESLNGPFCGNAKKRSIHNFALVDSVVSQTLFRTPDQQNKASIALNEFLSKYDLEARIQGDMTEGRLHFSSYKRLNPSVYIGGIPSSLSLQGPWRMSLDGRALMSQQMGRIRFDTPVLVTSLVVRGNVSVRARLRKKERWRGDSPDVNECRVGSTVLFRRPVDEIHVGTILFYAQNVAYVHDANFDLTFTRYRAELVGVNGQNCENIIDRQDSGEVVVRPTEVVDEIFFYGDEEFDLVELHVASPVQVAEATTREPFLVVLPNHHLYESELSIFAPLLTVDDLEQHGLELAVAKVEVPPFQSTYIKVIPRRQFDHIMLCLEENAISGVWNLPLNRGDKLALETSILEDAIKAETKKFRHIIHWEVYFNRVIEVVGFDYMPYFVNKCPNHPVPEHWLKVDTTFTGVYQCGSSPSNVSIKIVSVTGSSITAEFLFTVGKKHGAYLVQGSISGRVLTLRPTANGWRRKPDGYVSVGIIGILQETATGKISYEGSVLAIGCGTFSTSSTQVAKLTIASEEAKKMTLKGRRTLTSTANRRKDEPHLEPEKNLTPDEEKKRRCAVSPDVGQCERLLHQASILRQLRLDFVAASDDDDEYGSISFIDLQLSKRVSMIEQLAKLLADKL